jgi:hypothetical protein
MFAGMEFLPAMRKLIHAVCMANIHKTGSINPISKKKALRRGRAFNDQ